MWNRAPRRKRTRARAPGPARGVRQPGCGAQKASRRFRARGNAVPRYASAAAMLLRARNFCTGRTVNRRPAFVNHGATLAFPGSPGAGEKAPGATYAGGGVLLVRRAGSMRPQLRPHAGARSQALTSWPPGNTNELHLWGSSSAGRASPSQGGGRGFKSLLLHQEFQKGETSPGACLPFVFSTCDGLAKTRPLTGKGLLARAPRLQLLPPFDRLARRGPCHPQKGAPGGSGGRNLARKILTLLLKMVVFFQEILTIFRRSRPCWQNSPPKTSSPCPRPS